MAVVMAPIMVAPMAMVTDAPRAVIGPDHPAAVRVIIVGRRIVDVPVKAVVPECEPVVAKAATVENMTAAKPAAVKGSTAASMAAAMEAAATVAVAAMAAMAAADFSGQPLGSIFRRGHGGWIDQRKRFCALDGGGRQHQHRGGRKAQSADKAAPGIWIPHHA